MKFGLSLPTKAPFEDIHKVVETARIAEESGWDGFFLWDHISPGLGPLVDPWVAMTAVAGATSRMRLGLLVTPLSRRRPWKVAREIISLDHLTNGRMVLGVGLGDFKKKEFEAFGEVSNQRLRGEMLDEGLEIIVGLQSGEPFTFSGNHYRISVNTVFNPKPIQRPRVPIWVAGKWPNKRPFRRAARWDGAVPLIKGSSLKKNPSADEVREMAAYIQSHRTSSEAYDFCVSGVLPPTKPREHKAIIDRYEQGGATWWIEFAYSGTGNYADNLARVRRGPLGS